MAFQVGQEQLELFDGQIGQLFGVLLDHDLNLHAMVVLFLANLALAQIFLDLLADAESQLFRRRVQQRGGIRHRRDLFAAIFAAWGRRRVGGSFGQTKGGGQRGLDAFVHAGVIGGLVKALDQRTISGSVTASGKMFQRGCRKTSLVAPAA